MVPLRTERFAKSPLIHYWHVLLGSGPEKGSYIMRKSLDTITDVIRNPKHPFPQVADRPDKPHKNRYERRKVKQYIQLGDWVAEPG
jgi:hypothetical protein